jgi:hypothetical protein
MAPPPATSSPTTANRDRCSELRPGLVAPPGHGGADLAQNTWLTRRMREGDEVAPVEAALVGFGDRDAINVWVPWWDLWRSTVGW